MQCLRMYLFIVGQVWCTNHVEVDTYVICWIHPVLIWESGVWIIIFGFNITANWTDLNLNSECLLHFYTKQHYLGWLLTCIACLDPLFLGLQNSFQIVWLGHFMNTFHVFGPKWSVKASIHVGPTHGVEDPTRVNWSIVSSHASFGCLTSHTCFINQTCFCISEFDSKNLNIGWETLQVNKKEIKKDPLPKMSMLLVIFNFLRWKCANKKKTRKCIWFWLQGSEHSL